RAVLYGHIVQRAPAGEVGAMVMAYIAGILMPGKLHPDFGALHDILVPEQIGILPERRLADLGHQIAEDKLPDPVALSAAVMDKVAAIAVVDTQDIGACRIHLPMNPFDKALALVPQHLQMLPWDHIFQYKIALFLILLLLCFCDKRSGNGHRFLPLATICR